MFKRRFSHVVLLTLIVLAIIGCSAARRFGDTGGSPVEFSVHVERGFFDSMSNRQWQSGVGVGGGGGFSSGRSTGIGLGLGIGFSAS